MTAARSKQLGDVDEVAASAVMGHSMKMWRHVYDKEVVSRGAANNIAALAEWRLQVLAVGGDGGGGVAGAAAVGTSPAPICVDLTMDSDSQSASASDTDTGSDSDTVTDTVSGSDSDSDSK